MERQPIIQPIDEDELMAEVIWMKASEIEHLRHLTIQALHNQYGNKPLLEEACLFFTLQAETIIENGISPNEEMHMVSTPAIRYVIEILL